jgi:predicted MFS family arabinose efflux permease
VKVFFPYLFVFFFWAMANNLFRTSMDVQVLKTDTGDRTGTRVGLYHGGRFLGLTIGMIIGGYLLSALDFEKGLAVVAAISFALVAPALRLAPTKIARVRLADYKADFSDRRVVFFAVWLFLFATHWGPEQTCYGLFLRQALHLNLVQIGWYMAAEFFAAILTFAAVANKFNDTKRILAFAVAGLAFSGVGHIGMVFPPVAVSVLFRAIHGVGDGIIMMVMYVGVARLFDLERLGGNAGLVNLSAMAGSVLGALLAGPIGQRFGYALPLWVSGVITLALIAPILLRRFLFRAV